MIRNILTPDELFAIHAAVRDETGFFGAQGAGCLVLAKSTGRILIAHRSDAVMEPGTWGTWGGAMDPDEDPRAAVLREMTEETGHDAKVVDMIPLMVFASGSFRYHNFLVIVDDEFEPDLDWETQDFGWFETGSWPVDLHFGLESLLADVPSMEVIASHVGRCRKAPLLSILP